MDCIFCKIVAGTIPSFKIYEDAHVLAFMDINPLTPGHALVIPKRHMPNLLAADEDALQHTIVAARKVANAIVKAMGVDSMNLIQANGKWAAQTVQHLHFHLIPRMENDGAGLNWVPTPGVMDVIKQNGERVKAALK